MDVDIGNILYIVITIVAISLGLLGNKKKKPAGGSTTGSNEKPQPGFLENLEKVFTSLGQEDTELMRLRDEEPDLGSEGNEYEPYIEPVIKEEQEHFNQPDPFDHYREKQEVMGSAQQQLEEERISEPLQVIELDEEEQVDFFSVIKEFDAEKAIVYSAIINPLDY